MSMSLYVVGFQPTDEEWNKMKAVWNACKDAGIEHPAEVEAFFDEDPNDKPGKEIDLTYKYAESWSGEGCEGYQLDITKLPKTVKIIRFYYSY